MSKGIHHVTAITGQVQANVDFYAGFLGLKLVKQTAGMADEAQLHLVYGDGAGSPGSLVTFLVWEGAGRGRPGHGAAHEIALAVPAASIGDWLTRALAARVPVEGPAREFGEPVLRLRDPDGLIVKLVGTGMPAPAPLTDPVAPSRLRAVSMLSDQPEASAAMLSRFGYRPGPAEGAVRRYLSDLDAIDLRDARGFVPVIPGAGTIDHVAFRAADAAEVRTMRLALKGAEALTSVHDRRYFLSLYVRDAAGILFEHATDGPGFAIDEPAEMLGTMLQLDAPDPEAATDLRLRLPQFAMPGAERMPMRDLPFIHRIWQPEDPDGSALLHLHGTGGDEADLMPLAHRIAPRATLIGLRGRSTEEGVNRWFRRLDMMRFDQADIRAEAEALAGFIEGATRSYGLDPARMAFIGYSNGANLLGAALLLHPGLIRRAILLRAIAVLDDPPAPDLTGTGVLMLTGAQDPYARLAPPLEDALGMAGASLDARHLPAGHALTPQDTALARDWLAQSAASAAS